METKECEFIERHDDDTVLEQDEQEIVSEDGDHKKSIPPNIFIGGD